MTSPDSPADPTRRIADTAPTGPADADLESVTALALGMGGEERETFLASVFATDASARNEVESRVRAMLGRLNAAPGASQGSAVGPAQRYRIVRLLGRGGMGAVYLAERSDGEFTQRVALKTLHGEVEIEPEFVSRMAGERQILANLNHPNIARLLDGGSDERGAPYLVMEYVEGCSLTAYCEQHALGLRQRVQLFLKVMSAVQAAHQALVVHRDIKPANILVSTAGEPKLLDFGIAKLLANDPFAAHTVRTQTGFAPMTLRFAAPEQVLNQPITVAVDVHALGLVLYELLAEAPPYPAEYMNAGRLAEAIASVDPIAPSAASAQRGQRARARLLAGDLDAILLKALRKRPGDRYASVQQFADDLQRWLDGRPVEARQGTSMYRLRRQLRRNWLPVAASAAVIASLAVAAWNWRAERDAVTRERDSALASANFLSDLMVRVDPTVGSGGQLSARELIDQGAERIRTGEDIPPVVRQRLYSTLGRVYLNLGEPTRAAPFVEQTFRLQGDPESRLTLARLRVDQARYPEALEVLGALPASELSAEQQARAKALQIECDFALGRVAQGRQGLADWVEALRADRALPVADRARAWIRASSLSTSTGEVAFCRGIQSEAEQRIRDGAPEHSHWLAELRILQARCERSAGESGDPQRAVALGEQALELVTQRFGPSHPRVAQVLIDLSIPLVLLEQYPRATQLIEQAIAILTAVSATETELYANAQLELARIARTTGKPERAQETSAPAIALLRSLPNVRPDNLARALNNHALELADLKRFDAAAAAYEESLAIMGPLRLPSEAFLYSNVGRLYCDDLKQPERGAERLRKSLELIHLHQMDNGWFAANTESNLGVCLAMAGDFDAAEPLLRDAIAPLATMLGEDNLRTSNARQRYENFLRAKASGAARADVQVYR